MKKPQISANIQDMGDHVGCSHYEKYGRKYYLKTREERLKYCKEYYNANSEQVIKRTTKRTLKWRYNLTPEELVEMHKQQNNVCKICGKPPKKGRNLDIDHDHITGKIRGLLCNNCNRGLGHLQDSISILQNAIEYLDKAEKSKFKWKRWYWYDDKEGYYDYTDNPTGDGWIPNE